MSCSTTLRRKRVMALNIARSSTQICTEGNMTRIRTQISMKMDTIIWTMKTIILTGINMSMIGTTMISTLPLMITQRSLVMNTTTYMRILMISATRSLNHFTAPDTRKPTN